jgi:hypothetical protein
MPDNIDEMLMRIKPTVASLFNKMRMIDEKIVDFTAARNKLVDTGITHPKVMEQIEAMNNIIKALTSTSSRIKTGLKQLSDAMKAKHIIGGGTLDANVEQLMKSLNEYLSELNKYDIPNISESELDKIDDKLKALSYAVTDRLDDINDTIGNMTGSGKKKNLRKTTRRSKQSRKNTRRSKKSRKNTRRTRK